MCDIKEVETNSKCMVCGGKIVERFAKGFDPKTGPPIAGPSGEKQYQDVSIGFNCKACGLKYLFPPPAPRGG